MAELEQVPAGDCCSSEAQATCCEPADKDGCCRVAGPARSRGADWNAPGADAEEIRSFALGGLTRRLDVIGVPLSTL